MAKLVWDNEGSKIYELGVDHAVLYIPEAGVYTKGVAWNGITSVTSSPSGADEQKFYADNILYASIRGAEDFGGTIECYTYPDEFKQCNGEVELAAGVTGNQQNRHPFGLSYRTTLGNDEQALNYGYELHCVYNATVSPSEIQYQTINDSPEPGTMSFEFACNPINVEGYKPMSHVVINSTKVDAAQLKSFEDIIYGSESTEPRLPKPDEIATLFKASTPSSEG